MSKLTILKGEEAEKYANEMFGGVLQQISASVAMDPVVKEFTNNPDEWEVKSVSYLKTEEGIDEKATLYNAIKNSTIEISIINADQLGNNDLHFKYHTAKLRCMIFFTVKSIFSMIYHFHVNQSEWEPHQDKNGAGSEDYYEVY